MNSTSEQATGEDTNTQQCPPQKDLRFVYAPQARRLLCASNQSHAQLILGTRQDPASFTFHGMLYCSQRLYYVSQFAIERDFKQGPPPIDLPGFFDLHAALARNLPWTRPFVLSYEQQLTKVTENGCIRLFEIFEGKSLEEIIILLSSAEPVPEF